MQSVLVLSARPDNRILTSDVVSSIIDDADCTVLGENWAIETPLQSTSLEQIRTRIGTLGLAIDANVVAANGRRKKLMLADMDSTIITVECVDELADFIGVKHRVHAITQHAMAGKLDFTQALEDRVSLLKGLKTEHLQAVYDQRVSLTPGAQTLVKTMAAHGAITALVSGGFTFFTSRVQAQCGFHHHQSNELEIIDGVLTGRVIPPILNAEAKRQSLRQFSTALRLNKADTLCIGDGSNDRLMVGAAGLGIAFHGKEILKSNAKVHIDHGDLHAALVIQGYNEKQFVNSY